MGVWAVPGGVAVVVGVAVGLGTQSSGWRGLQATKASMALLASLEVKFDAAEAKPIQRPSALMLGGKSGTPALGRYWQSPR